MSKTTKKRLFFLLIVAALFLVSGCAPQTITDPETGETVTKLIYTTTTFKETFETENFFNALLVWPMAQVINYASPALGVAGAIALVTAGVHLLVTVLTWKAQGCQVRHALGRRRIMLIKKSTGEKPVDF